MLMSVLEDEDCPHCGADVLFGSQRDGSRSKVYVQCDDGCGFDRRAPPVDPEPNHADVKAAARKVVA